MRWPIISEKSNGFLHPRPHHTNSPFGGHRSNSFDFGAVHGHPGHHKKNRLSALGRLFKPWKWKRRKKSEKFDKASKCKQHFAWKIRQIAKIINKNCKTKSIWRVFFFQLWQKQEAPSIHIGNRFWSFGWPFLWVKFGSIVKSLLSNMKIAYA